MSTEYIKTIVRRVVEEGWNQGNLAVFDELYAPDFAFHDPNAPKVISRDDLKGYVATVRSNFPDFHLTIEDMIAEGPWVANRWTVTGTYSLAPGTYVKVTGFAFCRFSYSRFFFCRISFGKIVEQWHQGDQFGLWQQLGLIAKQASFVAV